MAQVSSIDRRNTFELPLDEKKQENPEVATGTVTQGSRPPSVRVSDKPLSLRSKPEKDTPDTTTTTVVTGKVQPNGGPLIPLPNLKRDKEGFLKGGDDPFDKKNQMANDTPKLDPKSMMEFKKDMEGAAGKTGLRDPKVIYRVETMANNKIEGETFFGLDKDGNKITGNSLGLSENQQTDKLQEQKLDDTVAVSGTTKVFDVLYSADPKVQSEFINQMENRFKDSPQFKGMDIYQNPQNYSVQDRVAQYTRLLKAKADFGAYLEYKDRAQLNMDEINKDLDQAMATLLDDPEVSQEVAKVTLETFREILDGKTLDPKTAGDKKYTEAVQQLRTNLEAEYKKQLVDGGFFTQYADKNEKTLLSGFNNHVAVFGALLSQDFLQANTPAAQATYDKFYNDRVVPLLPDAKSSLEGAINLVKLGQLTPAQLANIGSLTPIIDGKSYGNLLTNFNIGGTVQGYDRLTVDSASDNELKRFGIKSDALNSTLLTSAAYLAERFGMQTNGNTESINAFTKTVIEESRKLIEQADAGKLDEKTLDTRLEELGQTLKGPLAGEGAFVSAAVKGMVRGFILGANVAEFQSRQGLRPGAGGNSSENNFTNAIVNQNLGDLQRLTTLSIGFEDKGLVPETERLINSAGDKADRLFGVGNRAWDAAMIKKYGKESLAPITENMTKFAETRAQNVEKPIVSLDDMNSEAAIETIFGGSIDAMVKTLGAGQTVDEQKKMHANFVTLTYFAFSLVKPGGTILDVKNIVKELMTGQFKDRFASVASDPTKLEAASRWISTGLIAGRAIFIGMNNQPVDPVSASFISTLAIQGAGNIMGLAASSINIPEPNLEASFRHYLGEQRSTRQIQFQNLLAKTKSVLGTGATAIERLVTPLWLGVDLAWLITGWKSYDNVEKGLITTVVATDLGATLLLPVTSPALAATIASRIPALAATAARLTTGVLGASLSLSGTILGGIAAVATIALITWQAVKAKKSFKKVRRDIHFRILDLTGNDIRNNLGGEGWGRTRSKSNPNMVKNHSDYQYGYDKTFFDWAAVRQANREKLEKKYGANPQA